MSEKTEDFQRLKTILTINSHFWDYFRPKLSFQLFRDFALSRVQDRYILKIAIF